METNNKPKTCNPYTTALRSKFERQRKFMRHFYQEPWRRTPTTMDLVLAAAAWITGILYWLFSGDLFNTGGGFTPGSPRFWIISSTLALTCIFITRFRNRKR